MKSYKQFIKEGKQDIDSICQEYGIENYTIEDGLVNVRGDVDLACKNLTELPLKFGKVTGYFSCHNNQLTSLEGCPQTVGGHFYCHNNQLTTLKGGPQKVGGNFYCHNNQLYGLDYLPVAKEYYLGGNPIFQIFKHFKWVEFYEVYILLKEFDVIRKLGNKYNLYMQRLEEVFNDLGYDIPYEIYKIEGYEII